MLRMERRGRERGKEVLLNGLGKEEENGVEGRGREEEEALLGVRGIVRGGCRRKRRGVVVKGGGRGGGGEGWMALLTFGWSQLRAVWMVLPFSCPRLIFIYLPRPACLLAVFMKSHLGVLETQETQAVLLAGMEYLVSAGQPSFRTALPVLGTKHL